MVAFNPQGLRDEAARRVFAGDDSLSFDQAERAADAVLGTMGPAIADAIEATMTGPSGRAYRTDRLRAELAKLRGTIRALGQHAPAATE